MTSINFSKVSLVDYSNQRVILTKDRLFSFNQIYTIEVLEKSDWDKRRKNCQSNEIFNLGLITDIFNQSSFSNVNCESARALIDRLKHACAKHNKNPIQLLKFLMIPYIVAHILGLTCMRWYDYPLDKEDVTKRGTFTKLEFKKLKDLPDSFEGYTNLEEIHFINIKSMTELPKGIKQLKKLKSLNFEGCGLTDLSKDLQFLPELSILKLDKNPLSIIPEVIFNMTSLAELSINGSKNTNLKFDKETAWRLQSLTNLRKITIKNSGLKPEANDWLKSVLPNCPTIEV